MLKNLKMNSEELIILITDLQKQIDYNIRANAIFEKHKEELLIRVRRLANSTNVIRRPREIEQGRIVKQRLNGHLFYRGILRNTHVSIPVNENPPEIEENQADQVDEENHLIVDDAQNENALQPANVNDNPINGKYDLQSQ